MIAWSGVRPTADRCGVGWMISVTSRPLRGVRLAINPSTAARGSVLVKAPRPLRGGKYGQVPLDRCEG